ncbi:MAG: hypothetical protein N2040_01380 [Caldimonas manganoxidans]|nr:hypothetical protein [Caldimonas manganoxidans]
MGTFVLRALLLAAGLVFALSLLLAALVLLALWGLRWGLSALWARLTGRPVPPRVMPFVLRRWRRVDPREGFGSLWPGQRAGADDAAASRSTADRPGHTPLRAGRRAGEPADVTDVQARPVAPAAESTTQPPPGR